MSKSDTAPLFTFGMIADVQYAGIDNKLNYRKTRMRYYKDSLENLREAIQLWNVKNVDFVLQLGDLIDGFSRKNNQSEDFQALIDVLMQFKCVNKLPVQKLENNTYKLNQVTSTDCVPYICHMWGNHEFYNFTREELWNSPLNSFMQSNNELSNYCASALNQDYYFSFALKSVRFIALDTYDISICGRTKGTPEHAQAEIILNEMNKNDDKAQPHHESPHHVSWNGGLSDRQLSWLHEQLKEATNLNEKVVILSHIPLHYDASDVDTVVYNLDHVLEIVGEFNCVVACFAGHYHDGNYFYDNKSNIHFLTLPGVVERGAEKNAFCVVSVFDDHLFLKGYGGGLKDLVIKFS